MFIMNLLLCPSELERRRIRVGVWIIESAERQESNSKTLNRENGKQKERAVFSRCLVGESDTSVAETSHFAGNTIQYYIMLDRSRWVGRVTERERKAGERQREGHTHTESEEQSRTVFIDRCKSHFGLTFKLFITTNFTYTLTFPSFCHSLHSIQAFISELNQFTCEELEDESPHKQNTPRPRPLARARMGASGSSAARKSLAQAFVGQEKGGSAKDSHDNTTDVKEHTKRESESVKTERAKKEGEEGEDEEGKEREDEGEKEKEEKRVREVSFMEQPFQVKGQLRITLPISGGKSEKETVVFRKW